MDYYTIINGQKKGPFDTISVMKLIRSGEIVPTTLVSMAHDGEFIEANQYPLISEIFHNQEMSSPKRFEYQNRISLGKSLADGVDLWSRYALSFTIISGIILAASFGIGIALSKVVVIADYPAIGSFIISFVTGFLYLNFFGYILFAKRSQTVELGIYMSKIKSAFGANIFFAIILALFTTANAINPLIGIVAIIGFLIFATLGAFTPFIVFDKKLGFGAAYGQSSKKIRKGGSDTIGVVLAIVAINIIVAILPAIFFPKLFIFGLFISLPITVSALAYIYDEIFG